MDSGCQSRKPKCTCRRICFDKETDATERRVLVVVSALASSGNEGAGREDSPVAACAKDKLSGQQEGLSKACKTGPAGSSLYHGCCA